MAASIAPICIDDESFRNTVIDGLNGRIFKTQEEYVDIVCDELEYLREDIVINRITGDPDKEKVIEPIWLIKKFGVLNEIDKEMERRNTYQGIKYRA